MPIFQIKRYIFTLVACFPAHIRYWLCARIRPNLPEIARNVPEFARNAPEFARITYKFPLKRPKYISGTFRALGIRARKIRPNSPEIYFGRSKYVTSSTSKNFIFFGGGNVPPEAQKPRILDKTLVSHTKKKYWALFLQIFFCADNHPISHRTPFFDGALAFLLFDGEKHLKQKAAYCARLHKRWRT